MLKKRIIFSLLFDGTSFVLSRNFRLQKVGDIDWLKKYYDFKNISQHIDELVVLNVSRDDHSIDRFCSVLEELSVECFVPIAAGGGIKSLATAYQLMSSGADKLVFNTLLVDNPSIVKSIGQIFGRQAIVASIDCKKDNQNHYVYGYGGSKQIMLLSDFIDKLLSLEMIGEIYINSIDKDGTGQGYDLDILTEISNECKLPIIMCGGAGNSNHLSLGLKHPRIDAVSTANLLNFVGDGLQQSRFNLIADGHCLSRFKSFDCLTLRQ